MVVRPLFRTPETHLPSDLLEGHHLPADAALGQLPRVLPLEQDLRGDIDPGGAVPRLGGALLLVLALDLLGDATTQHRLHLLRAEILALLRRATIAARLRDVRAGLGRNGEEASVDDDASPHLLILAARDAVGRRRERRREGSRLLGDAHARPAEGGDEQKSGSQHATHRCLPSHRPEAGCFRLRLCALTTLSA